MTGTNGRGKRPRKPRLDSEREKVEGQSGTTVGKRSREEKEYRGGRGGMPSDPSGGRNPPMQQGGGGVEKAVQWMFRVGGIAAKTIGQKSNPSNGVTRLRNL